MNLDILKSSFDSTLPGLEYQMKMARVERANYLENYNDKNSYKHAAVAIILFPENNDLKILMIKRPQYDGAHSGQMAFPGGKKEKTDKDYWECAIRETREEVGVKLSDSNYLGYLTNVIIPISNFIVWPFVAYLNSPPKVNIDPREVEDVYFYSFIKFFQNNNIISHKVFFKNKNLDTPAYNIDNQTIWGASAMMISELVELFRRNKLY